MSLMPAFSFSPAKSKSPVSRRRRSPHPTPPPSTLDLMHLIPKPGHPGDESEVETPEWMSKRQSEPLARSPKRKKQPLARSPKRRKADGSPNADRTRDRQGFKAVNGAKSTPPIDGDSDEDTDEDASSSDERNYRAIPVNLSTPKFNSNSVKLAKRGYDISENEGELSEGLDFSNKKAKDTPNNSRFEYDDATDLSSGEESSIPDAVPHSKRDGNQGSQTAPGHTAFEIEESDSDDDLGERSYKAVRSSGVGLAPSTESVYENRSSQMRDRKKQADARTEETTESSDESMEEPSSRTDSDEESVLAPPTDEEPIEESISERVNRSVSEEVPAATPTKAMLDKRAGQSSDGSIKEAVDSGEENAAVSSDESEGPQDDINDSDQDAPPPQTPLAAGKVVRTQSRSKTQRPRSTSATKSNPSPRVRNTKDAPSSRAKQGPARLGPLAAREDQILNDTIEHFLTEHGLTDEEVPSLVKGDNVDNTDEFWAAVYEAFPNRTSRYVRAIVKRRHTKYSPRGKWSKEEDAQLRELAEKHQEDKNKWLTIGKILDRTAVECRDRYRNYALCGSSRKIGPWKAKDLTWFLHAVSNFIPEDDEKGDLPDGTNYKIEWLEVSAGMEGRRSRQQCLAKWKTMGVNPRKLRVRQLLHGRGPSMSPELRTVLMQVHSTPENKMMRLVQAVSEYEVVVDLPIPWRKLEGGQLTKELRVETLNIIWMRLRKGFRREVEGKSDQEAARRIYEMAVEDPGRLGREVERHDGDVEAEEDIVKKPWKGLSTRMSGRGD